MPIEQPAGSHDVGQWQTLHNRHTGETLRMRRVVRDGVLCLELKGTLPARCDGPPLHIHTVEDERGIVASGTLSAEVDGRVLRVAHGDSVLHGAPRLASSKNAGRALRAAVGAGRSGAAPGAHRHPPRQVSRHGVARMSGALRARANRPRCSPRPDVSLTAARRSASSRMTACRNAVQASAAGLAV